MRGLLKNQSVAEIDRERERERERERNKMIKWCTYRLTLILEIKVFNFLIGQNFILQNSFGNPTNCILLTKLPNFVSL